MKQESPEIELEKYSHFNGEFQPSDIVNGVWERLPTSPGRIVVIQNKTRRLFKCDEVYTRASRVSTYLRRLGVKRGDRIGVCSKNSFEWVLLDLAAIKIGAVVAGYDRATTNLDRNLVANDNLTYAFTDVGPFDDKILSIEGLKEASSGICEDPSVSNEWSSDDVFALKFTSGSTGRPKCVGARVQSVNSSISALAEVLPFEPDDRILVFLPLSLLQQRYWIYSAIYFGHEVVVSGHHVSLLASTTEQPTIIMGVPGFFETVRSMVESIVELEQNHAQTKNAYQVAVNQVLGARIRYLWTGSAPARKSLIKFFFEKCGVPILEGYGMNETCIVTKNTLEDYRLGSVGKCVPGKAVTIDARGYIYVKSSYPVSEKYLHNDTNSNDVFLDNGVVNTGDRGYFDNDGFLYILGRDDDWLSLENGKNISALNLEEALEYSKYIAQSFVFLNRENKLSALIVPDARDRSIQLTNEAIRECNRENQEAIIEFFGIAAEAFTVENSLISSQYKIRRKAILDFFSRQISSEMESVT